MKVKDGPLFSPPHGLDRYDSLPLPRRRRLGRQFTDSLLINETCFLSPLRSGGPKEIAGDGASFFSAQHCGDGFPLFHCGSFPFCYLFWRKRLLRRVSLKTDVFLLRVRRRRFSFFSGQVMFFSLLCPTIKVSFPPLFPSLSPLLPTPSQSRRLPLLFLSPDWTKAPLLFFFYRSMAALIKKRICARFPFSFRRQRGAFLLLWRGIE